VGRGAAGKELEEVAAGSQVSSDKMARRVP
jgi:hypothetical protein